MSRPRIKHVPSCSPEQLLYQLIYRIYDTSSNDTLLKVFFKWSLRRKVTLSNMSVGQIFFTWFRMSNLIVDGILDTVCVIWLWLWKLSEILILDSYSSQVFIYLDPILIYISLWIDCLFEIRKIAVCFLWLSLPGDYRVTDEALLAETT